MTCFKLRYLVVFIYLWLCWVFIAALRLSLVVASREYSSLQGRLLVLVAFLFLEHGPQSEGSAACRTVLVASGHVGSSWARDQICVPCTGRRILYHWTTREVQDTDVLKGVSCVTAH